MTKKREIAWIVAACAVFLAVARPVSAEDLSRVVLILSRADMEASKKTRDVVYGQLSDLPVVMVTEWVSEFPPGLRAQVDQARALAKRNNAITVFWADLSVPEQIFLYISKPMGERILVRNIGRESDSAEARLETLAVIVQSSVKAILEGGDIGIRRPSDAVAAARPSILEAAISYGFAPYADDNKWHHGIRIDLSYLAAGWARIFLAYRVVFPVRAVEQHVALEIESHPIELGLAARWRLRQWSLEIGAAFFLDLVTVNVTSRSERIAVRDPSLQTLTGLSPLFRVAWSPNRLIALFFATQLDVVFNQPRYVVENPGAEKTAYDTIIAPWVARPFIQLGVIFTIL